MNEKELFSKAANDIMGMITQGMVDAIQELEHVKDPREREELELILSNMKNELVGYFTSYIDRRTKPRGTKAVWEDILDYFKIVSLIGRSFF